MVEDKSMTRKSNLALKTVISVLIFYIGWDGGYDGGDRCSDCPCDFFSVPMTTECWVIDSDQPALVPFPPSPGTEFDSYGISIPSVIDGGALITDDFLSGKMPESKVGNQ